MKKQVLKNKSLYLYLCFANKHSFINGQVDQG